MNEKEKLQKQIKEAKDKLTLLENEESNELRNSAIKKLEEYTDKEKIKFFDIMYKNANDELSELEKDGYSNDDNPAYAWEAYIEILSRNTRKFWDYWNSLN